MGIRDSQNNFENHPKITNSFSIELSIRNLSKAFQNFPTCMGSEIDTSITNLAKKIIPKRKLPINFDRSVSGRSGAWIFDQNDFPFFDKFIVFFQVELMRFKSVSGKSLIQFRFIHSENMTHQFSDTPIVS